MRGDNFTGSETGVTWNTVVDKISPLPLTDYADKQSNVPSGVGTVFSRKSYNTEQVNHTVFKATKDIEEGWYYFTQSGSYGRYANHIFYLAAPTGDNNPTNSSIAVKSGSYLDFYSDKYSIEAESTSGYRYQQAKHTVTDGTATTTSTTVPIYSTLNSHNYTDFMLYSVDRGYWYISPKRGLLNKIIYNNAETSVAWQNWANGTFAKITGGQATEIQSNKVDVITQYNANKSLGNMTNNTFRSDVKGNRSYNNAFIVYNKHRSTWYYMPAESTRVSSYLSNKTWYSSGDTPVIINLEDFVTNKTSPETLYSDIENRKMRSRAFFGLIDTTKDAVWVALPSTAASLLE